MTEPKMMSQAAPYPEILAGLVETIGYREHLGWQVWLEDDCQRDKPGRHSGESRGLTLIVQRHGPDTYHPVNVENCAAALLDALENGSPGQVDKAVRKLRGALARLITVNHYFPVPPATYAGPSWKRWLFDTLGKVDDHERMEDFVIGSERPFAPRYISRGLILTSSSRSPAGKTSTPISVGTVSTRTYRQRGRLWHCRRYRFSWALYRRV